MNITGRKSFKPDPVLHLKYVDDMMLAESINMKDKLVYRPESVRPLPDKLHAKTGHILPVGRSEVFNQLKKTRDYVEQNCMKINYKKTKVLLFIQCKNWDFMPLFELEGKELELVEEMKMLGIIVRSDMKWSSNTKYIVQKGLNIMTELL